MSVRKYCNHCSGTGECPECDGEGTVSGWHIETAKLDPERDTNFDQLLDLQKQARELRQKTDELCKLRPAYADKFREQMIDLMNGLDKTSHQLSDP